MGGAQQLPPRAESLVALWLARTGSSRHDHEPFSCSRLSGYLRFSRRGERSFYLLDCERGTVLDEERFNAFLKAR